MLCRWEHNGNIAPLMNTVPRDLSARHASRPVAAIAVLQIPQLVQPSSAHDVVSVDHAANLNPASPTKRGDVTMEKHIEIRMEQCTGCKLCELACSAVKTGAFAPSESRIRVSLVDIPEIPVPTLLESCDYCF